MGELMDIFGKEMSGILNWAVLGCLIWQSEGLKMPEAINKATAEYRTEQDTILQFINDKFEMHPDYSIDKDAFYTAWKNWCDDQGEEQARKRSKKWVTRQVTDHGFTVGGHGRSIMNGLRLRS